MEGTTNKCILLSTGRTLLSVKSRKPSVIVSTNTSHLPPSSFSGTPFKLELFHLLSVFQLTFLSFNLLPFNITFWVGFQHYFPILYLFQYVQCRVYSICFDFYFNDCTFYSQGFQLVFFFFFIHLFLFHLTILFQNFLFLCFKNM